MGHSDGSNESNFAMDTAAGQNLVVSGGDPPAATPHAADKGAKLLLWDVSEAPTSCPPLCRFRGHSGCINDVVFSAQNSNAFASIGDDKKLCLFDKRRGTLPSSLVKPPVASV